MLVQDNDLYLGVGRKCVADKEEACDPQAKEDVEYPQPKTHKVFVDGANLLPLDGVKETNSSILKEQHKEAAHTNITDDDTDRSQRFAEVSKKKEGKVDIAHDHVVDDDSKTHDLIQVICHNRRVKALRC